MQSSGELQESKNSYQVRLDDILSTPLTAENINSYADEALDNTIKLIDNIIEDPRFEWDITLAENKKETEDHILREVLGTDVGGIIDHIYKVNEDMHSIDKRINASRQNSEGKVYVRPDTYSPNPAAGSGVFQKNSLLPKAKIALFILENDFEVDLNNPEQFKIKTGTVRSEMMRQTPYDLIELPKLNRTILSCDEIGNRTFIFDAEKLEEAKITTDFLLDATKTELDQILKDHPKIGQSLVYSKNYTDRLKKVLANVEEQNINAEEKPKEANYLKTAEPAPEGWYTINGLARELGIADKTIKAKLSNIPGEEYKSPTRNMIFHYNLEEVKNLPEIQKLLDTPMAPEGWYTIKGLARELGIADRVIKAKLSNIPGKKYKDSMGRMTFHYNLEEVKNLPEIKEVIEKSNIRKLAKSALKATKQHH